MFEFTYFHDISCNEILNEMIQLYTSMISVAMRVVGILQREYATQGGRRPMQMLSLTTSTNQPIWEIELIK